MNQGKYLFAQLTDFLPRRVFDRIVNNHEGNKYVRSFTCWNQMLCMVFGQLTSRDSMRDLMLSLEAHRPKYYHLGFGPTVSRRNLGKANEKRSYKIFEEFACILIEEARRSCYKTDFEIKVDGNVFALDSTTIDLCLSIFWWAEFRRQKGGIKLHTLYDVKTSIPTFLYISNAKVHDVNILDLIQYEAGSFYVIDKAYIDYRRLHRLHTQGAFFVTRAKDNMRFNRMYSKPVDKTVGLRYDQETNKEFVFLTNNTCLEAIEIALLDKKHWEVELFFKWKVDRSIYEILQILSISLLNKTPIKETLTKCDYKDVKELNNKQLIISGF